VLFKLLVLFVFIQGAKVRLYNLRYFELQTQQQLIFALLPFTYNTLNTNRVCTWHLLGKWHLACLGIDARVLLTIFQPFFLNSTMCSFVAVGATGLSVALSESSGGMCASVLLDDVFCDLDLSAR